MLGDHILSQINMLEEERTSLNDELRRLSENEEAAAKKMTELVGGEDVGIEIFSPRKTENDTKGSIEKLKARIEDLRYDQTLVQEKLEKNAQLEEKYKALLFEIKNSEDARKKEASEENDASDKESTDHITDIKKQFLSRSDAEDILKRVDLCLDILYKDRARCKLELKNLKYYIKAVLSK